MIEYGPFDQGEDGILIPGAYAPYLYFFPNTSSTPQTSVLNKVFFAPMAAVVGGGSAINAMFFVRGSKEEYDTWESLGNPGWDFDSLLPFFKKVKPYYGKMFSLHTNSPHQSENFTRPNAAYAAAHNISFLDSVHGFGGPVQLAYSIYDYPGSSKCYVCQIALGH